MKTQVFFILFITIVPPLGVMAQDADALTIEQINSEAENAVTGGERFGLIRRCLASGNLDSVRALLNHPNFTSYAAQEASKLEPSVYQDRIFLMMLRTPWGFDAPANKPPSMRLPGPGIPALCSKVIAGRLPDESLDLEDDKTIRRFADPAYRHQLANRFAAAIGEPAVEYKAPPDDPSFPSVPDNKTSPPEDGAKPPRMPLMKASREKKYCGGSQVQSWSLSWWYGRLSIFAEITIKNH